MSNAADPITNPEVFDETDPHGQHHHGQHRSHVIVGPAILRTILVFLLFFTALTVATAQLEVWVEHTFNMTLPWWVNVFVAMSIAVVKTILVMAFFMQLKYDNPLNTVLMLFCFFALGLFLLFTGLDLFSRGIVYDFKAGPVIMGGTGKGVVGANDLPVTTAAKMKFMQKIAEPDMKSYLIIAQAIGHAAIAAEHKGEGGVAAAKVLSAHSHHMMDLHRIHALHGPISAPAAAAARELEEDAGKLRASGKTAAADIVAGVAKSLTGIDMKEAVASYSVEATFAALAAVAHGGGHVHGGHAANSADKSRTRSGLTNALDLEGGGRVVPHRGAAGGHAESKGNAEGTGERH